MERTDELYEAWKQVAALHDTWRMMHRRCENPKCKDFRWYGARGIAVSELWREFRPFLKYVVEELGMRPPGVHANGKTPLYSLDRIDVNGPYAPGNVRWADWDAQAANRRPTRRHQVVPGQRFGRLVVIREVEPKLIERGGRGGKGSGSTRVRRVLVCCDCGTEKEVSVPNLFRPPGKTANGTDRWPLQSCGCLKREKMRELAKARFTCQDGVPGYKLGIGV